VGRVGIEDAGNMESRLRLPVFMIYDRVVEEIQIGTIKRPKRSKSEPLNVRKFELRLVPLVGNMSRGDSGWRRIW